MQGRVLDNTYKLIEEIGRGGFGAVYRAVRLGAEGSGQVAIKLLNRNPSMKNEDYVRFQREATLMSQLIHPGIVTVYELGEEIGCYFIVMEFIQGPNLREYVKGRGGRLPLPDIIDVLVQAAEALDYVHSHHIIHRDIKPQNMLISESRERAEARALVKLVDFGVARLSAFREEQSAQAMDGVVGTYAYMAPEATGLTSWEIDSRADIYSLGIVAYELLAGRTPFHEFRNEEIMRAHVEREPPPIKSLRGHEVPPVLERIVKKCIAKNPGDRYQSMFALVCDLKRIQNDLRVQGSFEDFQIAEKDIGIGELLHSAFVARQTQLQEVCHFLKESDKDEVDCWAMIRSGIGLGKSRFLNELRRCIEQNDGRYLNVHFSESEQRLPFQSLSLAINDYLAYYERFDRTKFRELIGKLTQSLGEMAEELSRLIPVLRQNIHSNGPVSQHSLPVSLSPEEDMQEDNLDINASLDRRYVVPNERVNEAFLNLLQTLVGENQRLVFLMDDLHLADTSTLTLLIYFLETKQNLNFSFVFSLRDRFAHTNLILENFLRKLPILEDQYCLWDLHPFDAAAVSDFLKSIGMQNPEPRFVEGLLDRSGGSALQLHTFVKQMLAQNAILPILYEQETGNIRYDLQVDWKRLSQLNLGSVHIELLIGSLESIDRRELQLLQIAAVSHEACEFEYFKIDKDYSRIELETRLINLVRRGMLEALGDEHAPIQAKAFVFSHEKLRTAILSRMDMDTRRNIHLQIAQRIESLYKNPRREHILALAKHYDGAGELANPGATAKAFLRAVRIYINKGYEQSFAKYYLDKVTDKINKILSQKERIQRLREFYEAEYMIFAAQDNLVQASEVCRNLLQITYDPQRKETLQVFWAQLLLGLGRHQKAYEQGYSVLECRGIKTTHRFMEILGRIHFLLMGTALYKNVIPVLRCLLPLPAGGLRETSTQALTLMLLAQLHGAEENLSQTLLLGVRFRLIGYPLERWNVVFSLLSSAFFLREGNVQAAYRICEECESFLETQGMNAQQRWATVIRSLWLDYPMGRSEKLLDLINSPRAPMLPTSGILHFEAYGLKSWLRLLSPSSQLAKEARDNEARKRRKSDKVIPKLEAEKPAAKELLLENNNARRVLDAGEKGQYTSLALFADALRFALSDKIEPLRRATEQIRRQESSSQIGECFSAYALSFQSLVLGHQHEALKYYTRGTEMLISAKTEILSLVVSDALRLAVCLLPQLAVSFQAQRWPWGSHLRNALLSVDRVLRHAEGKNNPRRNAMTRLFSGFLLFMEGKHKESLKTLEAAIRDARTQRSELLECISLSLLGGFYGQLRLSRAPYLLDQALQVARDNDLRLLERQVIGMARLVQCPLPEPDHPEEKSSLYSQNSRGKHTTIGLNEILLRVQKLHESSSIEELLAQTTRIVMSALKANCGAAFLLKKDAMGRDRFQQIVCEGSLESAEIDEKTIIKFLSRSGDDPVRLIPLDQDDHVPCTPFATAHHQLAGQTREKEASVRVLDPDQTINTQCTSPDASVATVQAPRRESVTQNNQTEAPTHLSGSSIQTFAGEDTQTKRTNVAEVGDSDSTVSPGGLAVQKGAGAQGSSSASLPTPASGDQRFLVLIAINSGRTLLGWIAIPGVPSSVYSSQDIEQDFLLMGLHVGHILTRVYKRDGIEIPESEHPTIGASQSQKGESLIQEIIDGELPKDIRVESVGRIASGHQVAWRVYRLKPRRLFFAQWRFHAKEQARARKMGELLARHIRFFAYSLRQSSEVGQLETLMIKLFGDISLIFESSAREGAFESITLNLLIWDSDERRAIEGDFGGEAYSFSGSSEVEREYLQEIDGILSSDRLVYHERVRRVTGAGGWLYTPSERGKTLLPVFADVDFVENYLMERKRIGSHLSQALQAPQQDPPSLLALFCLPPEMGG